MQEGKKIADRIVAELGELVAAGTATAPLCTDAAPRTDAASFGRRSDAEVTVLESLGLAVEDVTAADLVVPARRRTGDRNGTRLVGWPFPGRRRGLKGPRYIPRLRRGRQLLLLVGEPVVEVGGGLNRDEAAHPEVAEAAQL